MDERDSGKVAHDFDELEPLHEPMPKERAELPLEPPPGAAPAAGSQRRELDKAPLVLRKAAVVLLCGSILPWGSPEVSWVGSMAEKLVCYLGVWIFYQSHVLKHGGEVSGLVASLGRKGPGLPMIVAGVVALVGLLPLATSGGEALALFKTVTEKAFLLLAGYTFVHIFDYEHGGKFNPMFPLLFLFAAIGGFLSIFTVVPQMSEHGAGAVVALLGTLAVTAAGCMSAYTMFVALKEAKAHGEAKRATALEARKVAREARRQRQQSSEE